MIKNKLLLAALFSLSLISFNTTQADTTPEPKIAVNNAIEKIVTSLYNNKITYNHRTQTVRIYPKLHCLGTTLFGIALLILGISILTDRWQGERVSSVAFGWILNFAGASKINKAIQIDALRDKPVVIINSDGITYQGEAFGDEKMKYIGWADVEKIIERSNEGRDLAVMAKESSKSLFIPVSKLPIAYEQFYDIAELYYWLAAAEADTK